MKFLKNPLFIIAAGEALRHALTSLLTLIIVNHYMGADIAQKILAGQTVTLYGGYHLSFETIIAYFLTVGIPTSVVVIWGWLSRVRGRFKTLAALKVTTPTGLKNAIQSTSTTQMIVDVAKSSTIAPTAI